jgi:hypothetical protein
MEFDEGTDPTPSLSVPHEFWGGPFGGPNQNSLYSEWPEAYIPRNGHVNLTAFDRNILRISIRVWQMAALHRYQEITQEITDRVVFNTPERILKRERILQKKKEQIDKSRKIDNKFKKERVWRKIQKRNNYKQNKFRYKRY